MTPGIIINSTFIIEISDQASIKPNLLVYLETSTDAQHQRMLTLSRILLHNS